MINNLVKKIPLIFKVPGSQTCLEGEFFKHTIKYNSLEHTLETKLQNVPGGYKVVIHFLFFLFFFFILQINIPSFEPIKQGKVVFKN